MARDNEGRWCPHHESEKDYGRRRDDESITDIGKVEIEIEETLDNVVEREELKDEFNPEIDESNETEDGPITEEKRGMEGRRGGEGLTPAIPSPPEHSENELPEME